MKKEIITTILLMLVCAAGGLLIGFNAGYLSNGLNAVLFVIGLGLVSMSTTLVGILQKMWRRRK